MLTRLTIKNIALIESADISFHDGLNVLSGETGAGKSVLLDSVNFVLGAKADRGMIRYGETECMVKAEFSVAEDSLAVALLRDMDIDTDGEIILSRKFTESGKNSIKINGNTVTATMLRKITDHLVDVHGQSEHFYLLSESNQLTALDSVVGAPLKELKVALKEKIAAIKEVEKQMEVLGGDDVSRARKLELLSYQIEEIEGVDLKEGEEDELLSKRNKINHMEKIMEALEQSAYLLSGDGGACDNIRLAKRSMHAIERLDESYVALVERLENLSAEAEDLGETFADLKDGLDFDEGELEEIESRLDAIKSLKRKYGANKEAIDEYLQKSKEEYALLSDCEGQMIELTAKREKLGKEMYAICKQMTAIRKEKGKEFSAHICKELQSLNISSPQFEIEFEGYEEDDVYQCSTNGLDRITFLFSANAGEPLKPLGKIISGGEMSRFMLAMKTQLTSLNEISTYIFDEIDAGISGKTAKVVAEKFARISKQTQIISVSHLPQICAMSDLSIYIEKEEEDGKTLTKVHGLSDAEKEMEVVRLLGGEAGDGFARQHAKELIEKSNEYKLGLNAG